MMYMAFNKDEMKQKIIDVASYMQVTDEIMGTINAYRVNIDGKAYKLVLHPVTDGPAVPASEPEPVPEPVPDTSADAPDEVRDEYADDDSIA